MGRGGVGCGWLGRGGGLEQGDGGHVVCELFEADTTIFVFVHLVEDSLDLLREPCTLHATATAVYTRHERERERERYNVASPDH